MNWIYQPCPSPDREVFQAARAYQNTLTKPPGSLGQLETLACQFAAWQGTIKPSCEEICIRIFAGDHGVCAQGVSAFPQAVTRQMLANFCADGAAISVLAKQFDADFKAINLGTVEPIEAPIEQAIDDYQGLVNLQIAPGTQDISQTAAMNESELEAALNAGREQVSNSANLFIAGEMGIGNTTSAAAIYSAVLDLAADACVGPGTGVDEKGVEHKATVVSQALDLHAQHLSQPIEILRCLGGLEIAAITGAYIAAAQNKIPSLIDGFISTAAALLATAINPSSRDWFCFAHQSAEPAHIKALDHLNAKPLLSLQMRLGEGSGAALAISLIKSAILLHNNMATFDSAGVNDAV